jgi:hypothetical protein
VAGLLSYARDFWDWFVHCVKFIRTIEDCIKKSAYVYKDSE